MHGFITDFYTSLSDVHKINLIWDAVLTHGDSFVAPLHVAVLEKVPIEILEGNVDVNVKQFNLQIKNLNEQDWREIIDRAEKIMFRS